MIYRKLIPAICLIFCAQFSIAQQQNPNEENKTSPSAWLNTQKIGGDFIPAYNDQSGLYIEDSLSIGKPAIELAFRSYSKQFGQLAEYDTLATHQLYNNQAMVLGEYTTGNGQKLTSFIGWKKGAIWEKAFEIILNHDSGVNDQRAEVDPLRAAWELYSNQHQPEEIAAKVFSKNGFYFYRGVAYRGMEIADAYGYMRKDTYAIDLTPLKIYPVNDQFIMEIGIYKTNGEGLYFLLWAKENNSWNLLIDFNF